MNSRIICKMWCICFINYIREPCSPNRFLDLTPIQSYFFMSLSLSSRNMFIGLSFSSCSTNFNSSSSEGFVSVGCVHVILSSTSVFHIIKSMWVIFHKCCDEIYSFGWGIIDCLCGVHFHIIGPKIKPQTLAKVRTIIPNSECWGPVFNALLSAKFCAWFVRRVSAVIKFICSG